jgi:predicted  nucleic acid-binding Zn-ribbon protein
MTITKEVVELAERAPAAQAAAKKAALELAALTVSTAKEAARLAAKLRETRKALHAHQVEAGRCAAAAAALLAEVPLETRSVPEVIGSKLRALQVALVEAQRSANYAREEHARYAKSDAPEPSVVARKKKTADELKIQVAEIESEVAKINVKIEKAGVEIKASLEALKRPFRERTETPKKLPLKSPVT